MPLPITPQVVLRPGVVAPRDDQHPVAVYLGRLAPGSRRAMAHALGVVASILSDNRLDVLSIAWGAIRYQHSQTVRAQLAERYTPAMANKVLAALRGVLREAWRLGQMSAEDYHRAADLPSIRGTTLPRGRALRTGEIRALFEACARDRSSAGARDAAMLALGYGAGLRRAELVALDIDDYDPESGALVVRSGKGRKARTAYVTNGSADALAAWLALRGTDDGPLFVGINKGGRLLTGRLSDQGVLRHGHQACPAGRHQVVLAARSPPDVHQRSDRRWGGSRRRPAARWARQRDDDGPVRSTTGSGETKGGRAAARAVRWRTAVLIPRRDDEYPYCTRCQHGDGCVHCFHVPRHTFAAARQHGVDDEDSAESDTTALAPPTRPRDPREHER